MKRYSLICVAPEIPGRGSYDDLDEAISYSDAHFEVYDNKTGTFPGAACKEDYDAAVERWRQKRCGGTAAFPDEHGSLVTPCPGCPDCRDDPSQHPAP